ncbi:hypothetical protein BC567DRAFT_281389 [Phyllosticta citribraziliensis]
MALQCTGTARAGAQCRNSGRYDGRCHYYQLPATTRPCQLKAMDEDLDAGLLEMLERKKREELGALSKTGVSDACPPSLVSITSNKNNRTTYFVPDLSDDGDVATNNDGDMNYNNNNNVFKTAIVTFEAIYDLHHTRRLFGKDVNAALDEKKRAVVRAMYDLGDSLAYLEAEHGGRL